MSGRAGRTSSPGGPGKISSAESPGRPDYPGRSGIRQAWKDMLDKQARHAH